MKLIRIVGIDYDSPLILYSLPLLTPFDTAYMGCLCLTRQEIDMEGYIAKGYTDVALLTVYAPWDLRNRTSCQ